MAYKDHVARVVGDDRIEMSCGVVKKLRGLGHGLFSIGFACCVAKDPSAASIVLLTHRA